MTAFEQRCLVAFALLKQSSLSPRRIRSACQNGRTCRAAPRLGMLRQLIDFARADGVKQIEGLILSENITKLAVD